MPAHRERELACARGSAGRPGSRLDNSTACSAPRPRRALSAPAIASSHQQHMQQSSPLRPSWRSCRRHVGRVEHARPRGRRIKKPEKTTATEPTQSEWRWATTRKYALGSLPEVGRSGTSARIALLQQVRLEGWSTRLSGRRKGGCGENGTYAPPEVLDTNDGPQPARHGQQGRCRRS